MSRVGNPYIMGATGQPCTVAYRKARMAQYPASAEGIRAACPRMSGNAKDCKACRYYDAETKCGRCAYDCAQLTRWAMDSVGIFLVSGATSQWKKTPWAQQGEIVTLPKEKLCLVFRKDDANTMGHVGISLGDGSCIHAKGHAFGVVRESLASYGRWTHWGIPQGLEEAAKQPLEEAFAALLAAVEQLRLCVEECCHEP